jgi:hypothetical protein
VIDVVLRRDGENAQVDVVRPHLAQDGLVELDDAADVECVQIAADALPLLGDGLRADREGSGHGGSRLWNGPFW